ncbi:MAG: hypothetical protein SVX43_10480 [Cyanobacteriota bacterium]|nr:hypothetical protein [Cyanobacteriota bacterium]
MSVPVSSSLKASRKQEKPVLPESIVIWQVSIEEVENAIDSYQAACGCSKLSDRFATPEFRSKLIRYTKAAIEETVSSLPTRKLPYHSLEMRLYLESCLYRSIDELLKEEGEGKF